MQGRQDLKDTEIGRIPKDWEVVRIGEIAKTSSGGTPSRDKEEYYNGNIPWVKSGELKDNVIYATEEKITEKGLQNSSAKLFSKGTLLIALYGATVGKTAILGINATTNQAVCAIIDKKGIFDPRFLQCFLIFRRKQLISISSGGAQPNISQEIINIFKVPLPPLPEQQKIAEILSTVDQAIEKVEESIAKTERLKSGLMQKLLTKGIGHKEFKDTEIGRIPKGWEVVRLESLINEVKNGFASGKRDENGIVQIRMNNVTTDGLLILDSYLKVPVPDNVNDWILEDGDFLFNNTNSYDLVGKSTIFKGAPFPCTFSNHFTRIRFRNNLVLPEIILCHFFLLWKKGYFKSVAIRHVGQSAVHTKYLLKLKLPLPPLPEQQKIAEILSTVDKRLELLRDKKERLGRVKKGLMNDLLTGKKRVRLEA